MVFHATEMLVLSDNEAHDNTKILHSDEFFVRHKLTTENYSVGPCISLFASLKKWINEYRSENNWLLIKKPFFFITSNNEVVYFHIASLATICCVVFHTNSEVSLSHLLRQRKIKWTQNDEAHSLKTTEEF